MSTPYERQLLQPATAIDDETLIEWGQIIYVDCSVLNKDITITLPWSQASTPLGEEVNQTFGYVHVQKIDNTPFKVFVEPFTGDNVNGSTSPTPLSNQWHFVQIYNNNKTNEVIISTNYDVQKLFSAVTNNIPTFKNTSGQIQDGGKKFSIDGTLANNSDNNIPTEKAVKTYVDSSVAGLLDYRGGYDASNNQYPSTGGSGSAGAILKGDAWSVTVNGILNSQPVKVGDMIIAKVDTPNQTPANWDVLAVSVYNNSITNPLLAPMAAYTVKMNATGNTTNPQDVAINTAFNQSFETNTSNIKMDGTVSVGTSNNIARADHVHPSDTIKQNLINLPTNNNIVTTDGTGQSKDSGKKFSTDVSLSANSDNNVPVETVIKYNIDYVNNRINNLPIGAGVGSAYYLTNDINGSYLTLSTTPKNGTQTTLTATVNNNSVLLGSFATASALNRVILDAGTWEFNLWAMSESVQATTNIYAEVYKLSSTNTETLLFTLNNSNNIGSTTIIQYSISGTQPSYTILATDKLLIKLYAKTNRTQNTLVTVYYNSNEYYSHVHTPLVAYHNNLAGLNGGDGANQYYHLTQTQYNNVINQSSTSQNGYLSSTDFTTFNNKQSTTLLNNNIYVGNALNIATGVAMSGDGTIDNTGKIIITKTNNVSFASSATTDTTNANNITSGTLPNARLVSVPNSSLANSNITIAGTSTALGGAITQDTITGLSNNGIIKRTGANALAIATINDLPFTYNNTYYVSPNGLDTNDGKTSNTPVLTLARALTLAGNAGVQIVIYPGTYTESISITSLNITITSPNRELSGIVNFTGTLTFAHTASSIRVAGISIANVVHNNAGSLYFERVTVPTSLVKSGGGYFEATLSDTQGASLTGTMSITGSGSVLFFGKNTLGALTINNANAIVTLANNTNSAPITVTAGTLGINNTPVFASSGTANAVTVASGGICYITNSTMLTPTNTNARVSFATGSFYSLNNVIYDKANSILNGTVLNRIGYFDNINSNLFINNITPILSSGTTVILTANSSQIQLITGSTAQLIQLPNATTLSVGTAYTFFNETSATTTINNAGASAVTTILLNTDATLTLVNNSTANGTWHVSASGGSSSGGNVTTTYTISHSFTTADIGKAVYYNGTTLVLAKSDIASTLATELIFSVPSANSIITIQVGNITLANWTNVTGATTLTAGEFYFVSNATAGQLTATEPSTGFSNPILKATSTTTAQVLQYRPSAVDYTSATKGYLIASLSVAQSTNIATGQLIKLDTQRYLAGNTISFNSATYTATLTGGRNYKILAMVPYCDPATLNNPSFQFSIKITGSTPVNLTGGAYSAASSDANGSNSNAIATIINATAGTTVQLEQTNWVSGAAQRIGAVNSNIYTNIAQSYPVLIIEEF